MPDRVEVQDVTCAAGVTAANPTMVTLTNVVACNVVIVTVRIPAGHAGLTGIALGYGKLAAIPRTAGAYISGDDEVIEYDLSNYPPGPQWQAFLCNLDTISHSWEVRFQVDEIQVTGSAQVTAPLQLPDIYTASSALVGVG